MASWIRWVSKKLGEGAGVWIYNLENDPSKGHAYRLNFKCTNNMAEYEALLLGLKLVKRLGAIRVSIMGDSELVIKQSNIVSMTRDPRLGFYRVKVVEILNSFLETKLAVIPRKHNMQAHSLAMFASTWKLRFYPNHQYTTEVRHRLAILDNLKNWQVFDNDQQINNFLTLDDEFLNSNIDTDITLAFDYTDKVENNEVEDEKIDNFHPTKFTKSDISKPKTNGNSWRNRWIIWSHQY